MRTWQVARYSILVQNRWNIFDLSSVDELNAAGFHKIGRLLLFFCFLLLDCFFYYDWWLVGLMMASNSFLLVFQLLHEMLKLLFMIWLLVRVIRFKNLFFLESLLVLLVNEFVVVLIPVWTLGTARTFLIRFYTRVCLERVFKKIKRNVVLFELVDNVLRATFVLKILEIRENRECLVQIPDSW